MATAPDAFPPHDDFPYYEATVTESTAHFHVNQYLEYALQRRYEDRDDVFVGANNFVYWNPHDKDQKQSPDVYVCFGAKKGHRRSYKVWVEGVVPQVIFEITSASSRITDLGTKKAVYEMLGVEEYYAFDPLGEFIPGKLQPFALKQGLLVPVKGKRIYSPRLELDLRVEGELLRLYEPGSSVRLPTYREADVARRESEQARLEAERRAERLAAELAVLRQQQR